MYETLLSHQCVILIVDDQVSDIQLLGKAAKDLGIIHFATSAEQALDMARNVRPDLVLLDIEMTGMDGFELCALMKSSEEFKDTAIIFATAHHQPEHEVRALELGSVDFLSKPINIPVARARIRTHVRMQQMIKALTNQDPLTGLPNRMLLQDRILQAIYKARHHHERVALLTLNLDNFKKINDAQGLVAGDKLLQQIASRLNACCRVGDTISRPSGDEFIILLPDASSTDAIGQFAHRLLRKLHQPFVIDMVDYQVTASIGISIYPDDCDDEEALFRHAEAAMQQAKTAGKNRYSFFCAEIEARLHARHQLEQRIQEALEQDQFEVYYQTKVDARDGTVIGAEALIRWPQQDGSFISPADFIPLAEQTGQIIAIGKMVLLQACRDACRWQQLGNPVCISVNISAIQLKSYDFVNSVRHILEQTGVFPELIEFEITESVLASSRYGSQQILTKLKKLGLRIAIDDFGTGYSSLAYLKMFPVDVLKIDRSFVQGMISNHSDAVILDAMIKLGKALDLGLVAEGVETKEQAERLLALGCHVMQGFHYCKPAPRHEIETTFSQQHGVK
ncbi:EAL domain-containing protein [Oceanimonas baumannii]|uniref:putative bifunctional diguanylate cyclase/phosphodiesterase n=1 Tax=Oceanimonas baumannii TaxID=129578 RepID=UPI001D182608|nr:EAL domain-containing protein [Oceanimonas baumannii]MCC4264235.1 EAL domain-containing protein [Oceanimonas baumannii]